MSPARGPAHVVVDGSNIATEGRSLPSLAQLSEAVASFMEEYPDAAITVVVDATFGHRIDKKEVKEFEEGIANNELVAPPAGAVGRGDAFVLSIAQKAGASILSNDSFQEFHGDYEWLFDEGRLIGGKPVPHVGWVFVDRVPVRGPVSRKATGGGRGGSRGGRPKKADGGRARVGSPEASAPMPVPTAPPPGRVRSSAPAAAAPAPAPVAAADVRADKDAHRPAPRAGEAVNELMPFLEFVQHHPVGTSVTGTVDSYSSHGAYVSVGNEDVRAYVPLRLMSDPAPTSARKVMRLGESVTLVVVSYAPARRSIDCAVPDLADAAIAAARADAEESAGDDVVVTAPAEKTAQVRKASAKRAPAKKTAAKKAAAKQAAPAKKVAAEKAPAPEKKAPVEQTTPAKKTAAKKAPTKKAAAKAAPVNEAPVAKAAPAKKAPAKKQPAQQAPTTTAAATKAPAKKAATKKAATKKAATKRSAPGRKAAAKKAPAKKAAAVPAGGER